ncbi:MAG: lysophospholipid acyltransferase family protein [Bdellovibrionota bacterium]
MRILHQYWKVVVIGFLMMWMVLIGNLLRLLFSGDKLRSVRNHLVQRLARVALAVLGVEVKMEGAENWRPRQTYLAVSNHLSYLDILLFASVRPLCFVSTVEVKRTKILGKLTDAAGCVYIDRRSRENLAAEVGIISAALKGGHSMIFFPEGTSTNGSSVLPFKRPLFAPAIEAGVPVLPAVLQPTEINGEPVTHANRDRICWYGDMEFAPHLLALAGLRSVKVTLKFLPEIPVSPATSREELVQAAQTAISKVFQPFP